LQDDEDDEEEDPSWIAQIKGAHLADNYFVPQHIK
jgi:hypothetical protein